MDMTMKSPGLSGWSELPPELELRESSIEPGKIGLWSKGPIAIGRVYGPFLGQTVHVKPSKVTDCTIWQIRDVITRRVLHYVDASKPGRQNWMRHLKCSPFIYQRNVEPFQKGLQIYYKTIKELSPGEELITYLDDTPLRIETDTPQERPPQSESGSPNWGPVLLIRRVKGAQPQSGHKKHRSLVTHQVEFKSVPRESHLASGPQIASQTSPLSLVSGSDVGKSPTTSTTTETDVSVASKRSSASRPEAEDAKSNDLAPVHLMVQEVLATRINVDDMVLDGPSKNASSSDNKRSILKKITAPKTTTTRGTASGATRNVGKNNSASTPGGNKGGRKGGKGKKSHSSGGPSTSGPPACPPSPPAVDQDTREFQFHVKDRHIIESNRHGKKVYRCDICAGVYRHAFSLKRHFIRTHINYNYLSSADIANCNINLPTRSPKRIMSDSELKKSGKKREWRYLDLYRCHLCQMTYFPSSRELQDHIVSHSDSPAQKRFACPQCDMTFPHKQNLVRHESVHSGVKPHACRYCHKKFPSLANQRRHERIHEELKPHDTTDGDNDSYSPSKSATKSYHPCLTCGQSFDNEDTLKEHVLTHPLSSNQELLASLPSAIPPMAASTSVVPSFQFHRDLGAPSEASSSVSLNTSTNMIASADYCENTTAAAANGGGGRYQATECLCTECPKKFSTYVNMCRHRRLAHHVIQGRRGKYVGPTVSNSNGGSAAAGGISLRDRGAPESDAPITDAEFLMTVGQRISDNLFNYVDGKAYQLKYRPKKDPRSPAASGAVETAKTNPVWKVYNFPDGFDMSVSSDRADSNGEQLSKANGFNPSFVRDPNSLLREYGLRIDENTYYYNNWSSDTSEMDDDASSDDPEEPVRIGRGDVPVTYLCSACGESFDSFVAIEDHKINNHPNVYCTHVEIEGEKAAPPELSFQYRSPVGALRQCPVPPCLPSSSSSSSSSFFDKELARTQQLTCTKCASRFEAIADLHLHILECGGDAEFVRQNSKFNATYSRRRGRPVKRHEATEMPVKPKEKKLESPPAPVETVAKEIGPVDVVQDLPSNSIKETAIDFTSESKEILVKSKEQSAKPTQSPKPKESNANRVKDNAKSKETKAKETSLSTSKSNTPANPKSKDPSPKGKETAKSKEPSPKLALIRDKIKMEELTLDIPDLMAGYSMCEGCNQSLALGDEFDDHRKTCETLSKMADRDNNRSAESNVAPTIDEAAALAAATALTTSAMAASPVLSVPKNTCPQCMKQFSTPSNVKKHIKEVCNKKLGLNSPKDILKQSIARSISPVNVAEVPVEAVVPPPTPQVSSPPPLSPAPPIPEASTLSTPVKEDPRESVPRDTPSKSPKKTPTTKKGGKGKVVKGRTGKKILKVKVGAPKMMAKKQREKKDTPPSPSLPVEEKKEPETTTAETRTLNLVAVIDDVACNAIASDPPEIEHVQEPDKKVREEVKDTAPPVIEVVEKPPIAPEITSGEKTLLSPKKAEVTTATEPTPNLAPVAIWSKLAADLNPPPPPPITTPPPIPTPPPKFSPVSPVSKIEVKPEKASMKSSETIAKVAPEKKVTKMSQISSMLPIIGHKKTTSRAARAAIRMAALMQMPLATPQPYMILNPLMNYNPPPVLELPARPPKAKTPAAKTQTRSKATPKKQPPVEASKISSDIEKVHADPGTSSLDEVNPETLDNVTIVPSEPSEMTIKIQTDIINSPPIPDTSSTKSEKNVDKLIDYDDDLDEDIPLSSLRAQNRAEDPRKVLVLSPSLLASLTPPVREPTPTRALKRTEQETAYVCSPTPPPPPPQPSADFPSAASPSLLATFPIKRERRGESFDAESSNLESNPDEDRESVETKFEQESEDDYNQPDARRKRTARRQVKMELDDNSSRPQNLHKCSHCLRKFTYLANYRKHMLDGCPLLKKENVPRVPVKAQVLKNQIEDLVIDLLREQSRQNNSETVARATPPSPSLSTAAAAASSSSSSFLEKPKITITPTPEIPVPTATETPTDASSEMSASMETSSAEDPILKSDGGKPPESNPIPDTLKIKDAAKYVKGKDKSTLKTYSRKPKVTAAVKTDVSPASSSTLVTTEKVESTSSENVLDDKRVPTTTVLKTSTANKDPLASTQSVTTVKPTLEDVESFKSASRDVPSTSETISASNAETTESGKTSPSKTKCGAYKSSQASPSLQTPKADRDRKSKPADEFTLTSQISTPSSINLPPTSCSPSSDVLVPPVFVPGTTAFNSFSCSFCHQIFLSYWKLLQHRISHKLDKGSDASGQTLSADDALINDFNKLSQKLKTDLPQRPHLVSEIDRAAPSISKLRNNLALNFRGKLNSPPERGDRDSRNRVDSGPPLSEPTISTPIPRNSNPAVTGFQGAPSNATSLQRVAIPTQVQKNDETPTTEQKKTIKLSPTKTDNKARDKRIADNVPSKTILLDSSRDTDESPLVTVPKTASSVEGRKRDESSPEKDQLSKVDVIQMEDESLKGVVEDGNKMVTEKCKDAKMVDSNLSPSRIVGNVKEDEIEDQDVVQTSQVEKTENRAAESAKSAKVTIITTKKTQNKANKSKKTIDATKDYAKSIKTEEVVTNDVKFEKIEDDVKSNKSEEVANVDPEFNVKNENAAVDDDAKISKSDDISKVDANEIIGDDVEPKRTNVVVKGNVKSQIINDEVDGAKAIDDSTNEEKLSTLKNVGDIDAISKENCDVSPVDGKSEISEDIETNDSKVKRNNSVDKDDSKCKKSKADAKLTSFVDVSTDFAKSKLSKNVSSNHTKLREKVRSDDQEISKGVKIGLNESFPVKIPSCKDDPLVDESWDDKYRSDDDDLDDPISATSHLLVHTNLSIPLTIEVSEIYDKIIEANDNPVMSGEQLTVASELSRSSSNLDVSNIDASSDTSVSTVVAKLETSPTKASAKKSVPPKKKVTRSASPKGLTPKASSSSHDLKTKISPTQSNKRSPSATPKTRLSTSKELKYNASLTQASKLKKSLKESQRKTTKAQAKPVPLEEKMDDSLKDRTCEECLRVFANKLNKLRHYTLAHKKKRKVYSPFKPFNTKKKSQQKMTFVEAEDEETEEEKHDISLDESLEEEVMPQSPSKKAKLESHAKISR